MEDTIFYVDEIRDYPGKGRWCHLWTTGTDAELDAFAQRIGLKVAWSHTSRGLVGRFYHYDLRPSLRAKAIRAGAQVKPLKEWIMERSPRFRR